MILLLVMISALLEIVPAHDLIGCQAISDVFSVA
jgi:hypothetical protein